MKTADLMHFGYGLVDSMQNIRVYPEKVTYHSNTPNICSCLRSPTVGNACNDENEDNEDPGPDYDVESELKHRASFD